MSTLTSVQSKTNFRSLRTITMWFLVGIIVSAAISAVSLYFSPVGARWRAQQLTTPAQVGVSEVILLQDDALNHIFSPPVISIPAGTTVTWTFADIDEDGMPVDHNVVFDDVASEVMATGTYQITFDEIGSYDYVCTLHSYMEGRVIVTES